MVTLLAILLFVFPAQDINSMPMNQRRDVFRASSSEMKAQLWHDHLLIMRVQALTSEQRATVDYALTLANADLFDRHTLPDDLTVQIRQWFTVTQARETFAQLGPTPPIRRLAHYSPDCECSRSSDYCDLSCFGNGCATSEYGCGTLWLYSCDGMCRKGELD